MRQKLQLETRLANRALDYEWKKHFRVNRETFEYIGVLLREQMEKQDTQFRDAVPVEKRAAIALWRFGIGECYRSVGEQFSVRLSTS